MANKPIPEFLTTHHSFPSGHVLLIGAAAYIITIRCRPSISISFWIFTALVCWARVYDKMHWPTDCFGGIVLGALFAALTHLMWTRRIPDKIAHSKFLQTVSQKIEETGLPKLAVDSKLAQSVPLVSLIARILNPVKLISELIDEAREDDESRTMTSTSDSKPQEDRQLQSSR